MRKLFLLLTLLVVPMIKSHAQVEILQTYKSLGNCDETGYWEFIDNNQDGHMWINDEVFDGALYFLKEAESSADDLAKSDSFWMDELNTYTITYERKCSLGSEFSILLFDGNNECKEIFKYKENKENSEFVTDTLKIRVDSRGFHKLAFYVKAPVGDHYILLIKNLLITYDARPELSLTLAKEIKTGYQKPDEKLRVIVHNNGSNIAKNYKCYFTVNGGTPVEMYTNYHEVNMWGSFSFESETPLTFNGYGTYDIELYVKCEGDTISSNDTLSYTIENREYAEMPYFEDFENMDYEMSVLSAPEKEKTWRIIDTETDGDFKPAKGWGKVMSCGFSKSNSTEWLFVPPVKLEPGYYAFEFDYLDVNPFKERLSMGVFYGDKMTSESMVNKIAGFNDKVNQKLHAFIPFYISNTQDCVIGLHTGDETFFDVVVDNLSLKAIDKPAPDIAALPLYADHNGAIRDGYEFNGINCSVANNSLYEKQSFTFNLTFDDQLIESLKTSREPMSVWGLFYSASRFPEMTPGRHIIKSTCNSDMDNNPDNNTSECELLMCKDPYLFYDFENGMPEGAELIVADEGTSVMNPDNAAWYIAEHNRFALGSVKSLTSSSNLGDNGLTTADRWFILPPVYVGNGGADIVWEDVMRVDESGYFGNWYEDYQVLVSTTDTSIESFKVLFDSRIRYTDARLQRIRLDEFAGQNIHIAYRLYSKGKQSLFIDNIGLYGDFEEVHTSVDKVAENSINVTVNGDMLNVGAEADRIDVIDIDGRIVATANNSSSVNIASLSSGVYMARVNVNGTVKTVKFVR